MDANGHLTPTQIRTWLSHPIIDADGWLVDLTTAQLEVCREPVGDGFGNVRVLTRGERVLPEAFPDLAIDIADLVG